MEIINATQLKARLDGGGAAILIMFMPAPVFESSHIPGSIRCDNAQHAMRVLKKDQPVIAYCSAPSCANSRLACRQLEAQGYTAVTHYEGGISAWFEAGYPLESCSDAVDDAQHRDHETGSSRYP
jgi:rhodanese-related sulfurtransferase